MNQTDSLLDSHALEILERTEQTMAVCREGLEAHQSFLLSQRGNHVQQPPCKAQRNYLIVHGVKEISDLPATNRAELTQLLRQIFIRLKKESDEMLAVYGVHDEHELAPNQKQIYHARMHALVNTLDHYP